MEKQKVDLKNINLHFYLLKLYILSQLMVDYKNEFQMGVIFET